MKIVTWAGALVGTPAFIFGYIFSRATWKNDVLLCIGGSYWVVFIIFFAIRKYDEMRIRRRQMKVQARRDDWDEKIRNMYGPEEDQHRNFN